MSKVYIILTGTIFDIGGGQIYCRNKYKFLQAQGWHVYIFSYRFGDKILIKELKQFSKRVIRPLKYSPTIFSVKNKEKVLNRILKALQWEVVKSSSNEIIIESHTFSTSFWGELLGKKLNAKHIIYLLAETFKKFNTSVFNFFNFKHERRELAGIHPKSLQLLFQTYKYLSEDEKFSLRAACTNVVEDSNCGFLENINLRDIKIGCISRLDKKFVMTLMDEIISFSNKYPNRSLTVVIIGDSPNYRTVKRLAAKQKAARNVKFIMTGPLFPIPKKLFSIIDIFFGVAGGASLPAIEGALTVVLDVHTHRPTGLLNRNSNQTLYGPNRTTESISLVLENVFIHNIIPSINSELQISRIDYRIEYYNHMNFIASSIKEKQYYEIQQKPLVGLEEHVAGRLASTIGLKGFEMLYQLYAECKRLQIQLFGVL